MTLHRAARHLLGVMTVVALAASVGAQAQDQGRAGGQGRQGGAPQPPPTNLQVLPKDWTRQQVVQVMQQFNQALGVQCAHCHVFNGPGDPMNDFATDVKATKNMARAMMRMTASLQPLVQQAVNKSPETATRVSCAMCHRGAATPVVPPPPAPAAPAGGAPTAAGPGRGN